VGKIFKVLIRNLCNTEEQRKQRNSRRGERKIVRKQEQNPNLEEVPEAAKAKRRKSSQAAARL